ncbi:MAG TPA: urea carboxylase, partial [Luteolibacter sp.]|nr:urea carboxylase [Luteolibacter sp.]
KLGFPLMLKSTAGGGGIGMKICHSEEELRREFEAVVRLSQRSFGSGAVFLERYVQRGRHVEVQIFGDGNGHVLALGERDCSVQRRNQKVFEETPAPLLSDETRNALHGAAVELGKSINYRSAGTVEFIYDADRTEFYFLEVNTRLQVEHGVTELVTGIDLVEWMARLALDPGFSLPEKAPEPKGHAIQARLYAEDPNQNFRPSAGLLTEVSYPEADGIRIDGFIATGTEVSPFYDPLLSKVMVHAETREAAIDLLGSTLDETQVSGIETNLRYLRQVARWQPFINGGVAMRDMASFDYKPNTFDVLSAGTMTTIQDWPGRLGLWEVGVPPSGPMDPLSFRLANRLVGNDEGVAALEITMAGPSLRFNMATTIAVAGPPVIILRNGEPIPANTAFTVAPGDTVKIGKIEAAGLRSYLAVSGGIEAPDYLGSKSTFTLGRFGGHGGRALLPGDVIGIGRSEAAAADCHTPVIPYPRDWKIGVLYGPHGAPDFFLNEDIETFFATAWEVHYNSARTGVRLIGPKPKWARTDGGEAGLHPSNLHDNAYAIGAVDFTGDMPVILGPDGPSLGGFVCPVVVVDAELWKLGQLRPGDKISFVPVSESWAENQTKAVADFLSGALPSLPDPEPAEIGSPILDSFGEGDERVVMRRAGDRYLLVEFGPHLLDLKLRFKAHVIHQWLQDKKLDGIIDLTPGIRSLQIHFDSTVISRDELRSILREGIAELPPLEEIEVPARVVHLPISWDDPSTREAIRRYMVGVNPKAPWCPSNLEFIRRINGLDSLDDVKRIFFDASYLVMGLGDVYLGAPVATPLDPRHRLVTTKYNPARTWTPENAVGIGGAYLCVYGMEGPGGYQFTGRTVQMWNRWHRTADFENPWLLRFFDQLRFYEVSAEELLRLREEFPRGRHHLKIEPTVFRYADYEAFLETNAGEIAAFRATQRQAFAEERQRWEDAGLHLESPAEVVEVAAEIKLPDGAIAVESPVTGNVWKIEVKPGDHLPAGNPAIVLEAMKMEITVESDEALEILEILVGEGAPVRAGQPLLIAKPI